MDLWREYLICILYVFNVHPLSGVRADWWGRWQNTGSSVPAVIPDMVTRAGPSKGGPVSPPVVPTLFESPPAIPVLLPSGTICA